MAITILELAANVRQKKTELENTCAALRHCGGDWTGYSISGEDAMKIAESGLQNCWVMLDRLHSLARDELAKATASTEVKEK